MLILKNLEILSQIELGQMSSKPSGVSLECTTPDSTHRKIVREFTRAKIAALSILNIST